MPLNALINTCRFPVWRIYRSRRKRRYTRRKMKKDPLLFAQLYTAPPPLLIPFVARIRAALFELEHYSSVYICSTPSYTYTHVCRSDVHVYNSCASSLYVYIMQCKAGLQQLYTAAAVAARSRAQNWISRRASNGSAPPVFLPSERASWIWRCRKKAPRDGSMQREREMKQRMPALTSNESSGMTDVYTIYGFRR